jgi:hypothetical protein
MTMSRFDFALPRPLKVELEIPGYNAKRAADRLAAQNKRELEDFQRGNGLGRFAKRRVQEIAQTPTQDVQELQASLHGTRAPSAPDLSDILGAPAPKKKAGRK